MPFVSKAQRRYLYATNPELAAEFEKETPAGAALPNRVSRQTKRRNRLTQRRRRRSQREMRRRFRR